MGGYGSGRSGGQPTTDDGLTLDLSKLLRDQLLRPGQDWGGKLIWTDTRTKREVGSIGYPEGVLLRVPASAGVPAPGFSFAVTLENLVNGVNANGSVNGRIEGRRLLLSSP